MTSETTEKRPILVVPGQQNPKADWEINYGILVVVATWIYLYFAVIPTLYDGLKDFLLLHGTQIAMELLTSTIIPNLAGATGNEVQFGTPKFYLLCGLGGILSCGITHTAIVPLDLVKCRIQVFFLNKRKYSKNCQVDPAKYKGIIGGFRVTLKEDGARGLAKGWAPTAIGYSLQGLGKFGFYELFKNVYADMLGEVFFIFLGFIKIKNFRN